jgi:hypothetical protein
MLFIWGKMEQHFYGETTFLKIDATFTDDQNTRLSEKLSKMN